MELKAIANIIIDEAIRSALPDEAVRRALSERELPEKVHW